jgi:hypothetical protein
MTPKTTTTTTPQQATQARYARLQRAGRLTLKEMLSRATRDLRLIRVLEEIGLHAEAVYVARYGADAWRREYTVSMRYAD